MILRKKDSFLYYLKINFYKTIRYINNEDTVFERIVKH